MLRQLQNRINSLLKLVRAEELRKMKAIVCNVNIYHVALEILVVMLELKIISHLLRIMVKH